MAEESAVGIRVIKAFGRETDRTDRFGATARRAYDRSMDAAHIRALYQPLMGFLPVLGLAVVLVYGGILTIDGSMTLGEFVAFYLYLTLLMAPFRSLGMLVGQAQRAIAGGTRIFEVLDAEPEIVEAGAPAADARRPGSRALRGRHLRLRPGRARRCSPASTSTSRPGARSPSSARRARARPPSPSSSRASTTPTSGRVLIDGDRRARPAARPAAPRGRHGLPGPLPLLDQRAREHRLRAARGHRRGGAGGRAHGPGRGLHRRAARGLRHRRRRARPDPLGRPAPAPRDRAGDHHRPAHPDPRRGDRLGRRVHRARDPDGARAP